MPDIIKVGSEYRLYCSNSSWGVRRSCIFLAVSDTPEGPYMIYLPETDYYYLFVSYGSLKSDYNIRIGRSRKITGPFYDFHGRDMTDLNDNDNTVGLMISCGYRWFDGTPYMAPGHNSVLQDDKGLFLVSHIREMNFTKEAEPSTLQIRRLYLTPDEWLIAAAQPYAGETLQALATQDLVGHYERIALTPSVPQGIQCAHPMRLTENGRMECCSVIGSWKMTGTHTLTVWYGNTTETIVASTAWDRELDRTTLMLSGLSDKGICTWYKKRPN